MNRRGFALISVLWLTVLLIAIGSRAMDSTRLASGGAGNRIALRRAAWGRAACAAILEARLTERAPLRGLDSVDLGSRIWCSARPEAGFGRVDVNGASAGLLRTVLESDSLVAAVRDWIDPDTVTADRTAENAWYRAARRRLPRSGPLAAIDELLLIRGFDSALVESLRTRLVVWPAGIGADCAGERCVLEGSTMVVAVEGRVAGSPIRARARLLMRRAGDRLGILLQEVE
jgi:type II secretory pathway component PulK